MRFSILVLYLATASTAMSEDLFALANRGDADALAFAIHSGNVNMPDKWGWTPLIHAANAGHYDACALLLDKGADASLRDKKGFTALDYVAARLQSASSQAGWEFWKKQGINLFDSVAPDRVCVDTNELIRVRELLEKTVPSESETNAVSMDKTFPVETNAVVQWDDDKKVMARLIASGFDVNSSRGDGVTPLMHAAADGDIDLCIFLIEHGANVVAVDNMGRRVKDYVCTRNGDLATKHRINELLSPSSTEEGLIFRISGVRGA